MHFSLSYLASANSSSDLTDINADFFLFTSNEHAPNLLNCMKTLRDRNDLCDVTLSVDNQNFSAHKIVLASGSPYFNAMFTNEHKESKQEQVLINGIDATTFESLLNFIYSSVLEICVENVQNLLAGANHLQLTSVVNACCDFLKVRIEPENCLGIAAFAEMHGCADLQTASWRYALENFSEVALTEEFLTTPASYLIELIRSEDLNVRSEEEVLDCVLRWFQNDQLAHENSIHLVLQHVKLPLIPWQTLSEKILSHRSLSTNPECQVFLTKAKNFQLHPNLAEVRTDDPHYSQYIPRKSVGQNMFIYVVGGETSPGRSTVGSVDQFDPVKNTWTELAPMEKGRRGIGVGILNGLLFAVGGSDGISALRLVECYDPHTNSWRRVADKKEERSSVAAIGLGEYLYAVGGYDGIMSCLKTVERYDHANDVWSYVAKMNVARSMAGVAALNNCLFAVGGYDGSSDLASCEMYDVEKDCWVMQEGMISQRCMAGVAVVRGLLYAVGGCDRSQSLNSTEMYDPEKNQWSVTAEMSEPRSGVGVAVVGRKLYAMGGYSGVGSEYCSTVECYDPETNSWSYVAGMRIGRRRFGCCS